MVGWNTAAVGEALQAFSTDRRGCMLHGEIGQEVPFEHIEALYAAFYEYGKYPMEWRGNRNI